MYPKKESNQPVHRYRFLIIEFSEETFFLAYFILLPISLRQLLLSVSVKYCRIYFFIWDIICVFCATDPTIFSIAQYLESYGLNNYKKRSNIKNLI